MEDIATLEKSSVFIRDASLCGLGQTAPNPVITTLRYFKDEYIKHIVEKKCEAGKCFKQDRGGRINMSVSNVKLKIDGVEVTVPEGTTILKAAKDNGIIIPTLCNLEGLTAYGGCRMCLVEISGSPKLFPACTTPVGPKWKLQPNSDRLKEYRKMVVQMLLAERTHICSVCVANDHCELQAMAKSLALTT